MLYIACVSKDGSGSVMEIFITKLIVLSSINRDPYNQMLCFEMVLNKIINQNVRSVCNTFPRCDDPMLTLLIIIISSKGYKRCVYE